MASHPPVTVRVLGPVEAELGGAPVPLRAAKPRLVLALLALRAGQPVSTEHLVDCVWGDEPPPTARKALQVHVVALRRALGRHDAIATEPGGYALHADVDVDRFAEAVASAFELAARSPGAALAHLERASSLWRGEPFADLPDAEALRGERTRLQDLHARASALRFRCLLDLGRHDQVVGELDAAVRAQPYREDLRILQMLGLYRSGRQVDALRAYQDARQTLAEDLGVSPSPELVDMERRILDHDPTLLPSSPRAALSTLPARIARLVGRDGDADAAGELLTKARLVTLTAVGGAGKTRLAVECAHRTADTFPDGTFFVDLTSAERDGDVLAVAMAGVGLAAGGVEPDPGRLAGFLASRRCLLLLDNCEHVLDGAAALASSLLDRCPELAILATSREALSVPGEHVVQVPLLASGDVGSPAVELFTLRATEASPGFRLADSEVAATLEICQRLDGIPLAIELAAALTRSMSPVEIERRLADRFALLAAHSRNPVRHHRTLQAAVDWSYSLLDPDEQAMLRRLAVFHGGFDLADAALVTGFDDAGAARLVDALVAKSLVDVVRRDDGTIARRRLLETIRAFAQLQLESAGEHAGTLGRHFERFVGSTGTVSFQATNHFAAIYDRNLRELANIVAAIDHGVATGRRAESALAVVDVFWPLVERGLISRHLPLLDDDHDLAPKQRATLLTGRTMRAYALYDPGLLPSLPDDLRPVDDGEVFDDIFPVLLAASAFAPVEGAEQRMSELDRLLPLAERSSTADANVAVLEIQRAGQFYSLGLPAHALEPAIRASRLSATGGRLLWDNVIAELGLMVLLGRRDEAFARLAELEQHDVLEFDLCRSVCAVGGGDPRPAAAALAESARRHVTGQVYLQEGDYLALFAAFRFDLGDAHRAGELLDAVLIRFPVIQWLVWPHVGQWTPETFVERNADMRARELARMSDPGWNASQMADLLAEEIGFWAPTE